MFSTTTEYALRSMVLLAMRRGAPLTAQQIASETKVPIDYLFKVLQSLGRAGLVQAQRGKNGGFSLANDPADISIYDVVQAVDPINTLRAPSSAHWFGTDNLGRDVFSRVIAGAAPVLTVAPLATALGLLGGITLGLLTGYYRGWVDDVFSRLVDALLTFPLIILAVLVLASLGRSPRNVILVIGIIFTPLIARTVRSAVLIEREREYVAAAQLRGERGPRIMVFEILPNITGPITVEGTIRLGYAIFAAATLAFLGLGIQDPSPDWGLQVANARAYVQIAWWMAIFPALALSTLVVGVNLIADGIRRVLEE